MAMGSARPAGAPQTKGKSSGVHLSLRPSDAVSGGLLDDVDGVIEVCEAVIWDYNGQQEGGPALHIHIKDDNGQEADQYFSAGKLDRVVPSEDGNYFDPAEGKSDKGLNNNCNAYQFLMSLVNNGFPEEKLDEGLTSVQGMRAHFNRVPQKKRGGLEGGDDKQRTILLVTKIHQMPWEKKGSAGKAAAKPGAAKTAGKSTPAATNGNSDVNDEAIAAVVEVLAANDGTFKGKTKLGMACFRTLASDNKNKSTILKLVPTEDFLTQEGAPWTYDPETEEVTAE